MKTNPLRRLALGTLIAALIAVLPVSLPAALAQGPGAASKAEIEAIVKEYLIKNPEIIQEALVELERRQREAEQAAVQKITADKTSPLYVSDHHTVVGNPKGDVTLVEFYDYNCGFCKRGLADIQRILDTDKHVRVVLKEYPILSPGSRDASMVGLALREQFDAGKLWSFHAKLMSQRGAVGKEQALGVARDLGADMGRLDRAMASPKIQAALEESQLLAQALGINGTPSYVVADEVVVGARGYDVLKDRIEAYRRCQKAVC